MRGARGSKTECAYCFRYFCVSRLPKIIILLKIYHALINFIINFSNVSLYTALVPLRHNA
jgi:hypothetical protein